MPDTCVFYLVWAPLGLEPLERFAASYRAHAPGLDHRLVFLRKGVEPGPVARRCTDLCDELDAEGVELTPSGRDLDAYLAAARAVDAPAMCFLNSNSEILASGWLRALRLVLQEPGVGLVGATGSNESALSSAPHLLRPLLRRRYPPFPNPHLRTNGFMLERALMLGLDWPATTRKRGALELESGVSSITRQVWALGLQALVIGRDGVGYPPERWRESATFRSGNQANLLVADNRTRQYDEADPEWRATLERMAWGSVSPSSSQRQASA
ncbi:MAG TPA: hypothetical protein VG294_13775 [Solirubrobacteraceae bacterium]|jgi:hypothetical protein|nr:hypothetical protein [Solirubrobacteraceae bacterium]